MNFDKTSAAIGAVIFGIIGWFAGLAGILGLSIGVLLAFIMRIRDKDIIGKLDRFGDKERNFVEIISLYNTAIATINKLIGAADPQTGVVEMKNVWGMLAPQEREALEKIGITNQGTYDKNFLIEEKSKLENERETIKSKWEALRQNKESELSQALNV